ncbi:MAG: hypothetical protein Faunusvirus8_6 [Faunusvirus sp.]|jgi:hypothetical protein|uniref:Uncharacterized protein n=1 Tax=Faunusvirus sp. TaxID=2487766 RepID=A0A3G5A1B1_9VIRU|nr:MAG: hypothetical protein Faunusvirus8_6 [Faunusvirus sp.]
MNQSAIKSQTSIPKDFRKENFVRIDSTTLGSAAGNSADMLKNWKNFNSLKHQKNQCTPYKLSGPSKSSEPAKFKSSTIWDNVADKKFAQKVESDCTADSEPKYDDVESSEIDESHKTDEPKAVTIDGITFFPRRFLQVAQKINNSDRQYKRAERVAPIDTQIVEPIVEDDEEFYNVSPLTETDTPTSPDLPDELLD